MSQSSRKTSDNGKLAAGTAGFPDAVGANPSVPSSADIYCPKFVEVARSMRSLGATESELCDAFGVSAETLAIWKIQDTEFAKACLENGQAWVNRLKEVVYQQALGRSVVEQTIVEHGGKRRVTIVKKEVAPNLEAAKFLLTNLDPQNWKAKPEAPPVPPAAGELKTLLHQISEMRSAHIRPVPLRPGEEKYCE